MEIHQLQITTEGLEDGSWRQRCNDRMEKLKLIEFPSSEERPSQARILQKENFGEKNSEIFELREAIQRGNVDRFMDRLEQLSSKKLPLSSIFDQVTPAGDSLLHEAAYLGKAEIAELIGHHFPKLLTKRNIKGDTPLHVASRSSERANIIQVILSQYAAHKSSLRENNKDEEITRMLNKYGNTALHEAVGSKDVEGVITLLVEADKYVTHYLNKSNKSPLYLAILSSSKGVNILLEVPFPSDKPLPMCHGNSPLHAAIYTKNTDLVKQIAERRPDLMLLRDENEGTPLHYAAAAGYAEGIHHLLENKSTLTALEWDSNGQLPIHLACKFGHIEVLKKFLRQKWAHPRILLTEEGQNILHVAAENGRKNVVQYLLKNTKFKQLINEKDNNGNTSLHLAAKNFHCSVLLCLTTANSIDVNLMNNEGLTVRDIVLLKNTRMTFKEKLLDAILINARERMNSKEEGKLSKSEDKIIAKEEGSGEAEGKLSKSEDRMKAKEEGLENKISILMIVATLIVTVTFAAGFTIPGGLYGSDDPNPRKRGKPVFANRTDFREFIVFDMAALCCSTFGATLLLVAQLVDTVDLRLKLLEIAIYTVILALGGMMGAFTNAVYLVVSDISWLKLLNVYFTEAVLVFGVLPLTLCWALLFPSGITSFQALLVPGRFPSNITFFKALLVLGRALTIRN